MSQTVETLKAKLAEWKSRIDGEDIHSIWRQVCDMSWRSAFFRSINESRVYLKEANGWIHTMLNEGYVAMHAMAIRRLVDGDSYGGPKGVNSITSLIGDIKGNLVLLTRENALAARGLIYDYEPIEAKAYKEAREEAAKKGQSAYGVSMEGWWSSRYWHHTWDDLCGVSSKCRSTEDRPPVAKLDELLKSLKKEANNVAEYANKHIAHAAIKDSRDTLTANQSRMTLDELRRAERVVVRVSSFIARCFVTGTAPGAVPVPQFDQFKNLDRPFVPKEAKEAMERAWEEHDSEISGCQNWDWSQPLEN